LGDVRKHERLRPMTNGVVDPASLVKPEQARVWYISNGTGGAIGQNWSIFSITKRDGDGIGMGAFGFGKVFVDTEGGVGSWC